MHSSRMRTVRSSGRISGRGVSAPRGDVCLGVSALGGVSAPGGVSALGGCLLLRGCLLPGVSAPKGVSALGVVFAPGGVCSGGAFSRGCLLGGCTPTMHLGGGIPPPPCTEADTPSPRGQTDACKNITFATSLRTVITLNQTNRTPLKVDRTIYLDGPVETRDGSVLTPTFIEKRPVQLEPFSLTEAPET